MKQSLKSFAGKLLLALLLLSPAYSSAQKLEWSDEVRSDNYNYLQIMGPDDEGYFVLKSNLPLNSTKQSTLFKKREYHVIYYDNNMHERWGKTLEGWKKDVRVERVVFANFRPLVFFSEINKDTKQVSLFAQWLDNKGNLLDTPTPLTTMAYDKKTDIENLELCTSRDQTKIACIMGVRAEGNAQSFRAFVINEQLAQLWSKQYVLPYNHKNFEPLVFSLSNEGQLNMLGIKYHSSDMDKASGQYHYALFLLKPEADSLHAIDLALPDKFISEAGFSIDNANKKIIVCGFYSGKAGYSAAGTFYASVDLTAGTLQNIGSQPFSDDFLTKFPGERKANNGKELLNYNVDKIVLRNDGGAVLTAESFYTSTSSYYDIFTHSYISRINYHYNNVMILSINPDASMDWGQVIQKSQTSTEDGGFYSSYCTLTYQSRLFYVYNDLSGRRNRVVMNTITTKGEISRTDLFTESNEAILISKAAKQIDDNVLLMPAEKGNKFHYLKITF